ncbi:TPA: AP2 domain-containing protein [Staphylococcus aureus]|nr:AP2 domain-containing protein [Staphylococcus aureus]
MVKSIFLQDGEEIFVDDEDYERVNQYIWTKSYVDNVRRIHTKTLNVSLSGFVLENGFQKIKNNDFTKNNITSIGYQQRWARPTRNTSSIYKGVYLNRKTKKWSAVIKIDSKSKYLGSFVNEREAAKAYNNAVDKYWDGQGYKNHKNQNDSIFEYEYKTYKDQKRRRRGKSKFKGVYLTQSGYVAQITYKRKTYHIGWSKNIYETALMFNKINFYLHGSDVILNDVPMTDELKEFISNWEIPDKIKALKGEDNGRSIVDKT